MIQVMMFVPRCERSATAMATRRYVQRNRQEARVSAPRMKKKVKSEAFLSEYLP